jgi:RNA polymerase sigma-70 factor (ECF subfamily)
VDAAPDEPGDDALMRAFVAGDARAFETLFERHRRALFTYLVHQTGDASLAEDLFQEVFLRLIRGSAAYRPGSFRAWLFTIARNAMTDDRRRTAVREDAPENEPASAPSAEPWEMTRAEPHDPVASSHAGELRAHIEAALRRLPEAQREVFLLRERAGLDLQRIAQVTGANLATVKSRMRYALAGLRRVLSSELTSLPEYFHE